VIPDSFLDGAPGRLDYAVMKQLVGGGLRFQLSFRWCLFAHTLRAMRSMRPH
jgi:hypothetical protein